MRKCSDSPEGHFGGLPELGLFPIIAEVSRYLKYRIKGILLYIDKTCLSQFAKWTLSMLIKIQPDATVCRYLFIAKSLYMFQVSQHPSSGVLKTVTAVSSTGHNIGTVTYLRVLIRPRWREVAVPEAAVTVFSTPDDGCCDTRNM